MNQTAMKNKELEMNKDLKEKEIEQRERSSRRDAGAKVLSSVIKRFKIQDPDWYKKLFSDLKVFASVPTYHRNGHDSFTESKCGVRAFSGIAIINWIPSIGSQERIDRIEMNAMNNPIYFSINNLQQQLRKRNSRLGEYEPADIALYLLAVTDIIEDVERAKFLLQLTNLQNNENKYWGEGTLQALGTNYLSELRNKSENWQNLAILIKDVNENLPIPYTLTYLQRRKWMSTFICRDQESQRSQVYLFKKLFGYSYVDTENELRFSEEPSDIAGLIRECRRKLNLIKDSYHFQHLLQDLRGAMLPEKWYKILDYEDIAPSIPYSEEPLTQIENIVTVPSNFNGNQDFIDSGTVHVTTGGYFYQGKSREHVGLAFRWGAGESEYADRVNRSDLITKTNVLNFHEITKVEPDDIVVATRLQTYGKVDHINGDLFFCATKCGTEVIKDIKLFYYDNNGNNRSGRISTDMVYGGEGTNGSFALTSYPDMFENVYLATHFRYLPLINISTITYSDPCTTYTTESTAFRTVGDANYYFPISMGNIEKIHRNCVISEFFITDSDFLPPLK